MKKTTLLAIETSCDETAAALVRINETQKLDVITNTVLSQIEEHQPYGGVVPEIASRAHLNYLHSVVQETLDKGSCTWDDIDRIAVTRGPGLAGALMIGVNYARGLSLTSGIPLQYVNHLEGHLASIFLADSAPDLQHDFPMLLLLVSGGHSALVHIPAWGTFRLLGQTLDDAAGEAFDKGAKLLNLGYPGGPEIEKAANGGNPNAVSFPLGMHSQPGEKTPEGLEKQYCFSFSGLKTALRYYLEKNPQDPPADIAASYQNAVVQALASPLERAAETHPVKSLACVGGVAKNALLRQRIDQLAKDRNLSIHLAPLAYCTDNAAMIAAAAALQPETTSATQTIEVKPSWPITG